MIKFSKDFIWKNEAWNLQKTVSGFKFNKNWRFDKILVRILYEKMRLEIFRFLRFCQGLSFWRSLLAFDAWFSRYLSWLEVLLEFIACLRCLTLFAICRGRAYFWRSLLFFYAWYWRYLSWLEVLLHVIACLQCSIL